MADGPAALAAAGPFDAIRCGLRRSSVSSSVADRLVPVVLEPLGDAGGVVVGVGDRLAFDGDGVPLKLALVGKLPSFLQESRAAPGWRMPPLNHRFWASAVDKGTSTSTGGRAAGCGACVLLMAWFVADDLGLREGLALPVTPLSPGSPLLGRSFGCRSVVDHAGLAGVDGCRWSRRRWSGCQLQQASWK